MGISELPDRRRARARAAASLLVAVLVPGVVLGAGSLPAPATAAGSEPPPVRLRPVPGSVVRSAEVPLTRATLHGRPGRAERRTAQLGTAAYDLVGVTWRASASAAPHLRVRTRSAGRWSAWEPLAVLADLPDAATAEGRSPTTGTEPLWVGPADGVQVGLRGARPDDLSLVLIDPGTTSSDAAAGERTLGTTHRRATPTSRPDHAPRPVIHSRRQWGADESWRDGGPWFNRTIQQVHIHHTVNANDYSRSDVPALIRGMYRYHTHDLGWSDIGYNFLVDRFGRIWQGRAGGNGNPVRGAHTLGFNNTSAGISVIGNFEQGTPSQQVLTAIVHLASWKLDRYHRDPQGTVVVYSHGSDDYPAGQTVRLPVIDGHRDTNQTACPGQHLYDLLPGIRRRAQSRVDRFSPATSVS